MRGARVVGLSATGVLILTLASIQPAWSEEPENRRGRAGQYTGTDEEREARRRTLTARFEALRSQTVGASRSPRTVVVPGSHALTTDAGFDLGGYIFKDGYPLLHDNQPGARNIALGRDAMVSLTPYVPNLSSGTNNSAFGSYALYSTTSGRNNTAAGAYALQDNTEGYSNTACGAFALQSNTTGFENTAIGASALFANESGFSNTAVGSFALFSNTAIRNTAVGSGALFSSSSLFAGNNTAMGYAALYSNSNGNFNTAVGADALLENEGGSFSVAVGDGALKDNISGDFNTAVGADALERNVTGAQNIALGASAGQLTTGSSNILIGNIGAAGENGTIRIGNSNQSSTFIEGIFGALAFSGSQVYITSANKLGTIPSSRRFKEEIEPMGEASAELQDLRPVTFRYKEAPGSEGRRPVEFGLIAEEVAEVNPDLVVYDERGEPYSVRYHALTPMLLNELQRLRREIEAQRGEIARLRARGIELDELAALNGELVARVLRLELGSAAEAGAAPGRASPSSP